MGIVGMILAIVVMIVLAYKGFTAVPLTLIASAIVIITNGLPIWSSYSGTFAGSFGNVMTGYFFIFVSSAVYAKLMELSGVATAIAYKFIDWFGTKRVMLVSALIVSVLTYGGISLFVVIFAVTPILFLLFKEANLPRHLIIAPYMMGATTYTMTCLPGSPQLTNVIPSQYLGTPLTAAPVFGIIMAILMFGCTYWYCLYAEKKARAKGEVWSYPDNYNKLAFEVDRSTLPSAGAAFAPIIVLIAIIVAGSQLQSVIPMAKDSTLLTTVAMMVASILCCILNWKRLGGAVVRDAAGTGAMNGITAIISLAAVVAFGSVVSSSPAFQTVIAWVIGVDMSPYFKSVFATAVVSGITGSSSAGLRICLENMAEYYIGSGGNLQILHRLMAIASGSLDTLPHVSGIFLVLSSLGLTHKTGYRHVFIVSVAIPAALSILGALAISFIY
ncbi:GntP family permease [Ruminococcaceae bacterium OttesenSCG-928-O06]|nr:GntP family permease [Ruminococcaceae bacterium OttesenSCG-928-O06]